MLPCDARSNDPRSQEVMPPAVAVAVPDADAMSLPAVALAVVAKSNCSSPLSSPPSSVLSSPLSTPPSSPSPPPEMPPLPPALRAGPYPSPPASQQTSHSSSPTPDGMDSGATTDRDGPPPTKRRRTSKERTTEYLDLRSGAVDPAQQDDLDRVLNVLHKRQKIVVIAGAGMSVSAGIPDFRSSTGLFKSLKEEHKLKGSGKDLFDASVYKNDTATSSFHTMVSSMSRMTKDAKPTAFHHMLATIANEDRLLRLYSQNVDGIDTGLEPLRTCVPLRKGEDGKWPRTVQLHGGLDKMVCSKCSELSDFDASLFSGPTPPTCPRCEEINDIRTIHEGKRSHGIGRLRPRMVLYNEHNPDDEAIGSVTREDLRKRPDAVIVVGTTLKVPGVRRIVREMCGVVRDRRDGVAIWLNNDLPPVTKDLEECFDIVVQGGCDDVATRAAMRKWDEPRESEDYTEISDEEAHKASAKKAEVHIQTASGELETDVAHAYIIDLPTKRHINNSFSPPPEFTTPKKPLARPIYSPMPHPLILLSTEVAEQDNITVNDTGLQTPTKSRHSTPKSELVSINDQLKNAGKAKKPSSKGAKPAGNTKAKKTNVKYVKPAMSQSKGPKSSASRTLLASKQKDLCNSFPTTKSASITIKNTAKKSSPFPTKSPSKLRHVLGVSEPMQTVSPEDPRQNASPTTSNV